MHHEQTTRRITMDNNCKQPISFVSLEANGSSLKETTSMLTLTFNPGVPDLIAQNIAFDGAELGALQDVSGDGTKFQIPIAKFDKPIKDGDSLKLSIVYVHENAYITPSYRMVQVWIKNVEFAELQANGASGEVTTDALLLKFVPTHSGMKPENFQVQGALPTSLEEVFDPDGGDPADASWYRMGIELPADVQDDDVVTVSLINNENSYTVSPMEKSVAIYVHLPKRTWSQVSNQSGASYTLSSANPPCKIALPVPFVDDSYLMHADGNGIVIDQPGDYEVSISVCGCVDKTGFLTLNVDKDQKSAFSVIAIGETGDTAYRFSADRTMMFPDTPAGTVFALDMKSQFTSTALVLDKACYLLVRRIANPENPLPEEAMQRGSFGHRLADSLGAVKAFKIKQRGGYVAHAGVNATWRKEDGTYDTKQYTSGKDMLDLQTYTFDVSAANIPEGATINFLLDVVTGDTAIAPQSFTYSSSGQTAKYTVKGTTGSPTFGYNGLD
jgi:hypothetical protein